jgi:hypothetical protein
VGEHIAVAADDLSFLNGDRHWVEFSSSEWQIVPSQGGQ